MSLQNNEWIPALVRPHENYPTGRTYFDWNDPKLKEWIAGAIRMQEVHVRDNNRTEWFANTPEERDAIALRILITVYGVRTPQNDARNSPSSIFTTYNRDERLHARKIKKMIVKNSGSPKNIHFNVIYISTATKVDGNGDFFASEEPVFVIKNGRKFVDKHCQSYGNFEEYKQKNNLPKGPMLFPKNGSYIPEDSDGKVSLELAETPATSFLKRVKAVTDQIVMVGGIVLGVTGVVTFFAPAAFSAAAMSVIQAGSFTLTTYSLVRAVDGIYDKTSRDESIRTEVLLLISSALSSYTGSLRMKVTQYARQGKTYREVVNKITQFQKNIFAAVNILTFVSSAVTVLSSFYDLWKKKERTWLDYYQFCMGLFMVTNVLTKPITIQGVFESEQFKYLNEIQQSLGSEEAKQEMSSTVEQQSTSDQKADLIKKLNTIENRTDFFELQCLDKIKDDLDSEKAKQEMSNMIEQHSVPGQKAYLIRNLKKIENPTEFFELINETGSVVTCTPDGLIVNGKLQISSERYNEIGKAVFKDKVTQITKYPDTAMHKSLLNEFGKHLPNGSDIKKQFEERLNHITNLPINDRKEAMRRLVEEFKEYPDAPGQAFRR